MPNIYRIVHSDQDVSDLGSIEAIEGVVRAAELGRYPVDEIGSEPLPSGHTSRRLGTVVERHDGQCTLDPDPWPDR
jgi:hypothetical protein